jgi:hypothetical protein
MAERMFWVANFVFMAAILIVGSGAIAYILH